ncbi:hypothetical protein E2562_036574 [Oryza meyeriana var. granulata]|uniref:Uncharacterized protein n=1 Tax=Oryza meyeriana var. granulata TaxID=110450 RepID=A0A6G1ECE8_9ORYZ|nr:hypothetical protein E2562_036574 [Oryza meyeriana var. granulata]
MHSSTCGQCPVSIPPYGSVFGSNKFGFHINKAVSALGPSLCAYVRTPTKPGKGERNRAARRGRPAETQHNKWEAEVALLPLVRKVTGSAGQELAATSSHHGLR